MEKRFLFPMLNSLEILVSLTGTSLLLGTVQTNSNRQPLLSPSTIHTYMKHLLKTNLPLKKTNKLIYAPYHVLIIADLDRDDFFGLKK